MIKKFRGKSSIIPDSCYISESVDLIGDVTLGENVSLWFGTVVRGDMHFITIGNRSNIQDNSVVHVTTDISPTRIGEEVTVGHNAIIHGATIEDRCLIGMGSIIMDDVVVGEGSIVGAGAVVPPNMIIPPRSLVVGLPAKIVRQTTDEELEMIIERAQHYIDFSQEYKNQS
ncbi:MAG: gamma carbonic anhydrase family protein [Candidatus Marinimicrobia bacterium]|nr:gamma carbonic anhydrase family protein [Candidatus Neomarinimicrobiota bacterium]MBT6869858.1 gamma carbonic anhydrase family protein [Candidatus Neomarinimicrobiota bacterium]MBT7377903.1 gamma carbonic anhydrase family protein [Candidatus Neomarinimicrobiota bacterium]|tara:strand:- start:2463 stop:2975 length:513 start_codon:yes stop_codon:yes gene_type:complete